MFYKIRQWPRQIRQGIKNLIIWFPVIWKDRWWDHVFLYEIMRYKLHLMEKNLRVHGHHVKHIEDANKIKTCVVLLDRLIKDEYHDNAFKNHYKKWGQPVMEFKDWEEDPEYQVLKINYPNVKTDKDKEIEVKGFKRMSEKEAELREQDLDMLFKLMRKNIQSWWD